MENLIEEYQNDHDLLIELRTEMRGMRLDVKNLNETTTIRVGDHETRLRLLEKTVETAVASQAEREKLTRLGGTILIVIVGIVEFAINLYIK